MGTHNFHYFRGYNPYIENVKPSFCSWFLGPKAYFWGIKTFIFPIYWIYSPGVSPGIREGLVDGMNPVQLSS